MDDNAKQSEAPLIPRGRLVGRLVSLAIPAVIAVVLMTLDAAQDPFEPTRERQRHHNYDGALLDFVALVVIEYLVMLAILRPWSYVRSWQRSLLALLVLLPWMVFSTLLTMHAGGILRIHALWVMEMTVTALVLVVWSGAAALRFGNQRPAGASGYKRPIH